MLMLDISPKDMFIQCENLYAEAEKVLNNKEYSLDKYVFEQSMLHLMNSVEDLIYGVDRNNVFDMYHKLCSANRFLETVKLL